MIVRISSGHALHFRSWDGECVVYDSFSGDTHLLDDNTAQLLQQLQASSLDVVELAKLVASNCGEQINEDFTAEISLLIADLKGLGLIEVCE